MILNRITFSLCLALFLLATTLHAADSTQPKIELDAAMLLDTNRILPASLQDDVWKMQPEVGRFLVVLPIRITPGSEAATLNRSDIALRGGRFLCWHVVTDDEQPQRNNRRNRGAPTADSRRLLGRAGTPGGPGGFDLGGPIPTAPRNNPDPQQQAITAAGELIHGVPEGAPRFARQITITPDREIHWELDRIIPGAEPGNTQSLYLLKARPDLLRELEPERPGTNRTGPTRGGPGGNQGNSREAAAKKREEQLKYREEQIAFRELRDQIAEMPDQYHQTLPSRVWAVFDVPAGFRELSITGPEAPLPWRIQKTDLEALSSIASRTVNAGERGLNAEAYQAVSTLTTLANDNHPLTHRLVATAIVRSNLIAQPSRGDRLYRLISSMLVSPDAEARRTIVAGLADVLPPTTATAALLRDAMTNLTPDLQLLSLRGILSGDAQNPQDAQALAAAVRPLLLDPNGPNAGEILEQVVQTVGDSPEAATTYASAINFAELPPDRLDQAITYIVSSAPTQPVSAAWLDRGLLGAFDAAVPTRTLEAIAQADRGTSPMTTATQSLTSWVFGKSEQSQATSRVMLTGKIQITSPQHALLNQLQSGDQTIRSLAWESLDAFTVSPLRNPNQPRRGPGQTQNPDNAAETINRILRSGITQPRTPSTLATFLAAQSVEPSSTDALIQVVLLADDDAARQAADLLLGSNRNVGTSLAELPTDERSRFGQRFYQSIEGEVFPVVGLLRLEGQTLPKWFGERIALGKLPGPSQWAANFNDDSALVRVAGSSDTELAAAAVASLVFSAGGDRVAVDEYTRRFTNLSDRTEAGLTAAWDTAKKEIFTRRLTRAAGAYQFNITVRPNDGQIRRNARGRRGMPPGPIGMVPGGPFPGPGGPGQIQPTHREPVTETTTYELATVELLADGSTVRFRHAAITLAVPTDTFAIRMSNPAELKSLAPDKLEDLDLIGLNQPIDLLPQADGSWVGETQMNDGSILEVALKAANGF